MGEEQSSRAILNANKGIANFIDYDVIKKDLQSVSDRLFGILSTHYGPFSGFAAIESGNALAETEFTKDGIGILRALELASPQENWMRKTIEYIGTKMETSVGDGTTSAMMFTAAMLKHMAAHIDELRPISFNTLREAWTEYVGEIQDILDSVKMMPEDRMTIRRIVYNQVYTSSHGDKELAQAMAKVYERTPKELWNRMVYQRRTYESPERFEIHETEGQYSMTCDVMMNGMLNKDFSTRYEHDNCTVYVMNDCIRQDCESWDTIIEAMKNSSEEKPFVLISHKRMATSTYQEFMEILDDCIRAGNSIACFQTDPPNPRANDFVGLALLAGTDVTKCIRGKKDAEITKLEGIKVKFKSHTLSLDNIYEEPTYDNLPADKVPLERTHYIDGKHLQFTDYMESLKELADNMAKKDNDPDAHDEATRLYRLFAKLKYKHTVILQIGGNALDNIAFATVVDDCVRAASKALTYGIVHGNNKSLYHAARTMVSKFYTEDTRPTEKTTEYAGILRWFSLRTMEALEDVAFAAMRPLYPGKSPRWLKRHREEFVAWWLNHNVDLLTLKYDLESCDDCVPSTDWSYPNLMVDDKVASWMELASDFMFPDKVVICQPTNTDISMLERFGEVALKYVLTERIIIHGTAYVDPSKRKK